ncbi:MAG: polysaccharide biosynthesis tyrosine autokinase [Winogradskyella sp.]|uniref:GumC family protein n=1 Tax=Winogradskyella sp. TaxID=1883156 RepID=UPI0025EAC4DE|nr:polysaccharide biosynthesis tyrosine autokinase [Winogradskyella sp.]NRB60093.1 polysaccharide biosynthesis tyrosine autokinase [Winogradskyella sp.]
MEQPFNINSNPFENESTLDIKSEIQRYVRYWPWFVLALVLFLGSAYVYLRYAPRIYQTNAKIKILDESDGLELPTSAFIFKRSNINLENEIEILTSYLILDRVVEQLQLNTTFFEVGTIQTSQINQLPFAYQQLIHPDSISNKQSYELNTTTKSLTVTNLMTEEVFEFPDFSTFNSEHDLPFNVDFNQMETDKRIEDTHIISYTDLKSKVLQLKSIIKVEPIGEQSDLLSLSLKGESKALSESILNKLIEVFNEDGINDRQLVSQRTIDFIEERFTYLAKELDSIEISGEDFKEANNIVDVSTDVQMGLEQRMKSEEELFRLENQLLLSKSLENTIQLDGDSDLLPANIGLENGDINTYISEYNTAVMQRDKLAQSGAANNPAVRYANSEIERLRVNIKRSLKAYTAQLRLSLNQLQTRNQLISGKMAQIPNKERLFKAIQRQQKIKESLYLLLLQKREEAAINLAITEPSIKVVENALSGTFPISPKSNIVYAGAFLAGLLLPFGILYLFFMLDTKLHSKEDISNDNTIPVVAEIPEIKGKEKANMIFKNPNDRTIVAEAFRILSANVDYILPNESNKKHNIIYCTSTIKGEGKTYISLNLSLALSSINKKVLLIGADLRNPQIHTHINGDKGQPGLSNYLHDTDFDWKDALVSGFEMHPNHHIMLSGTIPPNPAQLLTNGRFKDLVEEARDLYDYVIIDTAPTILVTDTLLISQYADATIYAVRANHTEKKLLDFSKDLSETGKLKNVAYVVNSVGASKSYGYSYNYGYGYGYGSD